MSTQVFKKDDAGIRELLQSEVCLAEMEKSAGSIPEIKDTRSFIGYDRAKVFVLTTEEVAAQYR